MEMQKKLMLSTKLMLKNIKMRTFSIYNMLQLLSKL